MIKLNYDELMLLEYGMFIYVPQNNEELMKVQLNITPYFVNNIIYVVGNIIGSFELITLKFLPDQNPNILVDKYVHKKISLKKS